MSTVTRDNYNFVGPRAEDSAKYYDTVISHGYEGDMIYLAWDSAHKFGTRMTAENMASFRSGVVIGNNALSVAEFLDLAYDRVYSLSEQEGRSKRVKSFMASMYDLVKNEFGIEIKLF